MPDNLISQLGRELKMEDIINASRGNHYLFPFEDEIDVEVILNPKGYFFKSILGKCPSKDLDNFLLQVSVANLFGNGTRGASLGFNENENFLTLSLELDYNCGYKEFKEKLDDFVSAASFWKEKITTH